jgi:phasin family protein
MEKRMFSTQAPMSAVARAQVENQIAACSAMTCKTFESMEKLFDLNFNVMKTSLEETSVIMKQVMAARGPQEVFSLMMSLAPPTTEKALYYSRHLANIASTTQLDISRTAETQLMEANRKVNSVMDDMARSAPAGSENMIALMKSAIGTASAGYEQLSKSTKQAAEAIEANLAAAERQAAAQPAEKIVVAKS